MYSLGLLWLPAVKSHLTGSMTTILLPQIYEQNWVVTAADPCHHQQQVGLCHAVQRKFIRQQIHFLFPQKQGRQAADCWVSTTCMHWLHLLQQQARPCSEADLTYLCLRGNFLHLVVLCVGRLDHLLFAPALQIALCYSSPYWGNPKWSRIQ